MSELDDMIVLKSGRVIDPSSNIIGIDDDGNIYQGYDSYFGDMWDDEKDEAVQLPSCDLIEIADIMIARWTAFKEAKQGEP